MCIGNMTHYSCGHTKKQYMNHICHCDSIIIRDTYSKDTCSSTCKPIPVRPRLWDEMWQTKAGAERHEK